MKTVLSLAHSVRENYSPWWGLCLGHCVARFRGRLRRASNTRSDEWVEPHGIRMTVSEKFVQHLRRLLSDRPPCCGSEKKSRWG
eukprot:21978_6